MKNVGIISEFNPFHNGHEYLIKKVREEVGAEGACIIAVMSGDFVQRGHIAMVDMWKRAEAAVACGVDLVLELPVWAACSGAETFAEGGIKLLNCAGNIDYLAFGAEAESLLELEKAAEAFAFETPELSAAIKSGLNEGKSYAKARAEAAAEVCGLNKTVLSGPNNILAIEYLKQLKRTSSSIKPIVVKRSNGGYFDKSEEASLAGAGWIRDKLKNGADIESIRHFIPENSYNIIKNEKPLFMEDTYQYIIYRLLTLSADEASKIDGAFEGLENRAFRAALSSIDYESLVDGIKTRRYSRTTVERLLIKLLLGITKEAVDSFKSYDKVCARVLAFNDAGAAYLRSIKKNDRLTVITNMSKEWPEDEVLSRICKIDLRASQIFSLIAGGCVGEEIKKHGLFKE